MKDYAEIGIFGGSGLYSLLDNVEEIKIDTPYGPPSDSIMLAEVKGRKAAFLPRHGKRHTIPPHKINYRANVWAFYQLGVKAVISPCAAGSLQKHIKPGDFVVCDQFIDRTKFRADTFYDGPISSHISPADMYSPELRKIAIEEIKRAGIPCHEKGTIVVAEGPRYSTKAESIWFTKMGWDVINMTQYPEAYLCHELGMNVVNIALATDYDSGVVAETEAVNAQNVLQVFEANVSNLCKVVFGMIEKITDDLLKTNTQEKLEYTRGDGHAVSEKDIRIFDF